MTVLVTHGAKKNVGDYLIHERGLALMRHLLPHEEFRSVARWRPEELVDSARLLVMCGGPGIAPRTFEHIFPVAGAAQGVGMPVAGVALGWSGLPAKQPEAFDMTPASIEFLRSITARGLPLGTRDDTTLGILRRLGIDAVRTGCTAWYSIPDLGRSRPQVREPRKIVFTTPAQSGNTFEAIAMMRALRRQYPRAELTASFHRGIRPDALTPLRKSVPLVAQAVAAKSLGYRVVDTAYDLAKIDFYREADLHVGYRVHAHLAFVSQRIPSLLISEDGRGAGQSATLHGEDSVIWAGSHDSVVRATAYLESEAVAGWPSLERAIDIIEGTYPVMREAIVGLRAAA